MKCLRDTVMERNILPPTAVSSAGKRTAKQAQPLARPQVGEASSPPGLVYALTPDAGLSSSGTQRNKLRRDVDEYDTPYDGDSKLSRGHRHTDSGVSIDESSPKDRNSKGAYWGDLSKDQHGTNTREPLERSRFDEDFTDTTGHYEGGDSRGTNQAVGGGLSGATKGTPDRSQFSGDTKKPTDYHYGSTAVHQDLRHSDEAVGGGVYNSVAGAGSPEYGGTRSGQPGGVVHDPLTSSTKGIPASGGNTYDRKTDFRGDGAPTSRNDHTGLGLAGAAAGVGAADYGAHEVGHYGLGDRAYNTSQQPAGYGSNHPAGVPRSSMLDPEPKVTSSTSQPGHIDTKSPTAGHFSGSPSHSNASAGSGPFASPTTSSAGGAGRAHYGPGHEGSKVLHTCQHCGRDNDISQYFSKDVVYRLGS